LLQLQFVYLIRFFKVPIAVALLCLLGECRGPFTATISIRRCARLRRPRMLALCDSPNRIRRS
jgi:hypothetical protein